MSKYVRSDYARGIVALNKVGALSEDIGKLKNQISTYAVNMLVKLDGDGIEAIANKLTTHFDDLNDIQTKLESVEDLKANNSSVSNAFESFHSVDSKTIDKTKLKLTRLESNITECENTIQTVTARMGNINEFTSVDEMADIRYWASVRAGLINSLNGYKKAYDELNTTYKDIQRVYDNVVSADKVTISAPI